MLSRPVTAIKGIGTVRASVLESEAGIRTVEDLLYYAPRRYLDRSKFKKISDCIDGETVSISGVITDSKITRRKREILEVLVNDGSGEIKLLFFSGLKFFGRIFVPDEQVILSGKITYFRGLQMVHPDFDFIDHAPADRLINTGRIVPLYRSTLELKSHGFDSRGFRKAIMLAIEQFGDIITEPLTGNILERNGLIPLKDAITGIHFPESYEKANLARKRLAFNEIFYLQYYLALTRKKIKSVSSRKSREYCTSLINRYISNLSFTLTGDQKLAIDEITADMTGPFPMNRMLQGDVGSGKTVVAIATSLLSIESGEQAAIMAPTEILASQHYATAINALPEGISCRLITGSTAPNEKKKITDEIKNGECMLIIGTHALVQDSIEFNRLGYIVIDEQHRFGVEQRAALRNKGTHPDLLVMTATPIPRTLSLTLYGDLDISCIREKPAGRIPVRTLSFPESRISGVYNSMKKYIEQGRQIYYVLPLIEESEKTDLKSAMEIFNHLSNKIFPGTKVLLMHGRLKQKEKDEVMQSFRNGEAAILVTTSVIEVGVDVPNASVIVIHHAERFGLAQLHQLRGRVGRGTHQSFCVLVHPDNASPDSLERLRIMTETDDGFMIAEKDLQMRGDGQLVGTRQHGDSGFEFMDPACDIDIITSARNDAIALAENVPDPENEIIQISGASGKSMLRNIRTSRILSILS